MTQIRKGVKKMTELHDLMMSADELQRRMDNIARLMETITQARLDMNQLETTLTGLYDRLVTEKEALDAQIKLAQETELM